MIPKDDFEKELLKTIRVIIDKFGNKVNGGSWKGIEETLFREHRKRDGSLKK